MNKTAIKNFAIWARRKLISEITYKAGLLGITESGAAEPLAQSTKDLQFFEIGTRDYAKASGEEIKQRDALVKAINAKTQDCGNFKAAFRFVVEEVAYTWFNRLIAIRFMEVNDYLPSGVRVLSSVDYAKHEPDFVTSPFDTDLEFSNEECEKINRFKDENKADALFRMLFIKQCNKLHEILPALFEPTSDFTELLLTVSYTDKDGIVYHLTHDIEEKDFDIEHTGEDGKPNGQVEIIGWLYQYYNTEPKDEVFALLKKNIKITKENIPAATQLFTPDWIVRYMVENSLGRLWLEGHPNEKLKAGWKYYLEEAEQEESVKRQLYEIRRDYAKLSPEDIKLIDPCMGSGHILIYAFDLLMQLYESQGYTSRGAVKSILENNLFGLDIDDRAAQLAYFAVMMKARQYDRRIFSRGIQPHVYAIRESNGIYANAVTKYAIDVFCGKNAALRAKLDAVLAALHDAKEYGSILNVSGVDFKALYDRAEEMQANVAMTFHSQTILNAVLPLIKTAEIMARKYDVVITNPPYMGGGGMSAKLSAFVKKNYPDSKSDLFACFIERCGEMTKQKGYTAMITQHAWMFLSSYEKLRGKLLLRDIVSMAHLGARAFEEIGGEVVQTTSFVMQKSRIEGRKAVYCRLVEPTTQQGKEIMFLAGENRFETDQTNFSKIPGSPVAYWVSEAILKCYQNHNIYYYAKPCKGIDTGNNDLFLRLWYEVDYSQMFKPCGAACTLNDFQKFTWFPYNKGGNYRKWYGNNEYILNWSCNGEKLKEYKGSNLRNRENYFQKGITWSTVTSGNNSFRYFGYGFLFDNGGSCLFDSSNLYYIQGLLNSNVAKELLSVQPTLNTQPGTIGSLPMIVSKLQKQSDETVIKNIRISKDDWNTFETSWDFRGDPIVYQAVSGQQSAVSETGSFAEQSANKLNTNRCSLSAKVKIKDSYEEWKAVCEKRFLTLKRNEEELNRIFIEIYGLQDELTPEVPDKDVTVYRVFDSKADIPESMGSSRYALTKQDLIKNFVSYAVGCMFGRYSLDVGGLAFAGGEFSGQWSAVSGRYYKKEVIEYYVNQELSRLDSMAKGDGSCNGDLQAGEVPAAGGTVRVSGADEARGSINSVKYCRGTRKKLYEGICTLPVDCSGIDGGNGNSAYDLCSPEILDAIANGSGAELVSRGWKDAALIDWKTIRCRLTTDHFSPDEDNCLPITDEEYFEDDIVSRFVKFVEAVFGESTLEENLKFIADALGNKGDTAREVIRGYFLNDFYRDHCKTYQKRPVYWLFDSGKQNGFKALCYMHRWNADTVGNMRVEYLHRVQRVYEREAERMREAAESSADNREKKAAEKRMLKLQKQLKEARDYDAAVAHIALSRIDIDLDDGVKFNYEKVQTAKDGKKMPILAKI